MVQLPTRGLLPCNSVDPGLIKRAFPPTWVHGYSGSDTPLGTLRVVSAASGLPILLVVTIGPARAPCDNNGEGGGARRAGGGWAAKERLASVTIE